MQISKKGIELLKEFESFSAEPYNDEANNATIGYGHLMHIGPVTEAEKSLRWTVEEAIDHLTFELKPFEEALTKAIRIQINQNQFDSLVCWVYNCGTGAMKVSSWLKALNRGEFETVPRLMQLWNKVNKNGKLVVSPGLVNRRAREAKLFEGKV